MIRIEPGPLRTRHSTCSIITTIMCPSFLVACHTYMLALSLVRIREF